MITDVAKEFGTSKTHVAVATTLTLAARLVGAALFGYWADRAGPRKPLLVDVLRACVVLFTAAGSEARGARFGAEESPAEPPDRQPAHASGRFRRGARESTRAPT